MAFLKTLPEAEIWKLQERFSASLAATGSKKTAIFMRKKAGGTVGEVAVFADDANMQSLTGMGGWQEGEASGDGWTLLAGDADAPETFGVKIGKD